MSRNLITKAAEYAERAHEGQTRKYTGDPYFVHVARVAHLVEERGGTPDMIAAAFLHDTVEDTSTTILDIVANFGPTVAKLVEELTDVYTHEAFPDKNRAERKRLECERMATISDEAKAIKLCDLIDNTDSIVRHDPGFAKIYLREKANLLESMGF